MIGGTLVFVLLLNTISMGRGAAFYEIEGVGNVESDSEYVEANSFSVTPVYFNDEITLSIHLTVIKQFPHNAEFLLRTLADKNGMFGTLETLDTYMCRLTDRKRAFMPRYLKTLTNDGYCIQEGTYTFPDAGLFVSPFSVSIRRGRYPIINTNEIWYQGKCLLRYDVFLSIK